jgi:DNA-binding SARP family transcriptional activator
VGRISFAAGIDVRLLGPIEAERDASRIQLGGPKQRAALALLAARPGAVVSTDRLLDALWGEAPPPTAATALQGHISQLRRLLGAGAIVTHGSGYALGLEPGAVDAGRFEQLLEESRGLPPSERVDRLHAALGLWRGPALADVAIDGAGLRELAERLEERRLEAQEELFDAQIASGRHVEVVAELEAFVRAEPTRERPVGQLMLALYRGGRQADALAAYRRFRQELNGTLALQPTRALRDLERQILVQDPELAPPANVRPGQPRRLPLTVAAIGLEPPGDDLDAEAYAQATARAREAVRLVFERHGAVVERAGSAVVGLFGTPTPQDDDAARAVAAAQAAVEAVPESRGGIASGDSFGSESAAIEQALRLQAGAAAGALEVDALTRSRAQPRSLRLDRPLAGRTAEQRRLLDLYDGAVQHRRSATVVLVGPAGIGKSRLAEALAASVSEHTRVLRTRCPPYGDGIGLLPAAELVRGAATLPADANPAAARARLEGLLAGDDRAAPAVEQLLDVLGLADEPADGAPGWAVRRLLEAVTVGSSTLVAIDDLHWAAPAFVEVVERLAEPMEAALTVVATTRDRPPPVQAEVVQLAPLDRAACEAIVVELLGGTVEQASLQRLVERAGGNPLFLEELVQDLRAAGRLRLDDVWRLDDSGETLPESIRSLLAMRIEHLPERERDLLGRCSVLGRSFTYAAVDELADGDVEDPLAGLVASFLLQPAAVEDDLEFRHGLIRDAAYASLPLTLRAELHERVAASLDRGTAGAREREALAVHHLDQAYRARATLAADDPQLAAAAAELATRAASLGHTLLAHGDAAAAGSLLARALELDPDRPLARIELGRARYDAGDLSAADEAWALAEEGPFAERARVGRLEVLLHTDPGCDLEGVGADLDALAGSLRERGDDGGLIEALLAHAYVSLTRGRIAELVATLDEALALAQTAGRSRAEAEILFLVCGASWYGPLPVADGIRRCEEVLADARDRPIVEAAALQALGVLRALAGEPELARATVEASRSIRRDIGQDLGAAASAIDAGLVELLAGEYAAAEQVLRAGYAELERLGEKGYFSTIAALLAEAVEAQGRPEEARELARASASAAAPDDVASHVSWRVADARALTRLGSLDEAQARAREAVAIADATDFSLLRADAWAAAGEFGRAAGILEQKGLAASAIPAWTRLPTAENPPRSGELGALRD